MATQLSLTKGLSRRGLWWWMACATSSLPVPLSPQMSTVTSLSTTLCARSNTARIGPLWPTMLSKPKWLSSRSLSESTSRTSARFSIALRTTMVSSPRWKGFSKKS